MPPGLRQRCVQQFGLPVFCGNLVGLIGRAFSARDFRLELCVVAGSAEAQSKAANFTGVSCELLCFAATLLNYSAGRFRQEISDWNSALPLGLLQPSLQQPGLHVSRINFVELLGCAFFSAMSNACSATASLHHCKSSALATESCIEPGCCKSRGA